MKETMGSIIRRLRKEQELTQEELAEQLGVTSQSVSKWENDTGMPDISQIVPLARLFGVSTDVLFGTFGEDGEEKVRLLRQNIYDEFDCENTDTFLPRYRAFRSALGEYPNSTTLLLDCLENGEGCIVCGATIDRAEVVRECEKYARILLRSASDVGILAKVHRSLASIYAAVGQSGLAEEEISQLPDGILDGLSAKAELYFRTGDDEKARRTHSEILYKLLREFGRRVSLLAAAYARAGRFGDAAICRQTWLDLLGASGFGHVLAGTLEFGSLAADWMRAEDADKGLRALEQMIKENEWAAGVRAYQEVSDHPLLAPAELKYYPEWLERDRMAEAAAVLADPVFDTVRDSDGFRALADRAAATEK